MSEEQTILEWQKLFDSKQTIGKFRNALAGDGGGTVDVDGEPGFIWCRYSADQSKVSKVFNMIAPGVPEDFPIKVGRRFPDNEFEEVLAVDWTQYTDIISQDTVDNFTTGNHGESHNAADGADPAPVDLRNIIEMRGRAQATPDLTIHIERGQYVFGYQDVHRYPSEDVDLTASVPAGAGHRYTLVYVDGVSNTAAFDDSVVVPLAATPAIPNLRANTIPICIVDLSNGQTTITEDDIFDWRFIWDLVTFAAPVLIGTNAERLALTLADLAELTRFYTTDTDKIWEVWEAAWRLVHEPSGLSTSDGDAGTPWSTDGNGVLTGTQNLVLDDGASNSPKLLLIGGSNDDQAQIFLDDDAVAGDSDLIVRLVDAAGDGQLIIQDSSGIPVFWVTSEGPLTQSVNDAVTNTVTDLQTLVHRTTGTAAAGFGTRHLWQLEDAGGSQEDAAALTVEWEDAAAASEDSLIRFYLRKAGVVLGEFFRFSGEGLRLPVGGTDIYPNNDGRGIAARWINPFTSLTSWTAHFRSGETTGPGNGTLTGYAWQGAPLGGAPVSPGYSINNDYFRAAGAAATKHFMSTAITNAAASWQDKEITARVNTGITTEIGVRYDAGNDNNWVELFMTGVLADATQRLDFRYRDNGGAITTVTSNLIVPVDSFITIRLICTFSGGNYTANGVVVNEAGGSVNVTGFSHLLTGNWAVGPPTAGRAGVIVANAGNFGNCDWFYNTFT